MTKPATRHLLGIDQLCDDTIDDLIKTTCQYLKNPPEEARSKKHICHLFFESSTRTRISFEMAAHRVGYKVFDAMPELSSIGKGETLLDTARTLYSIGCDALVIRHPNPGTPHFLAQEIAIPIINAGDGIHEHPTQGLLDAVTILVNKGRIKGLTVAYCGDVKHSRVAGSGIRLLKRLGAHVRVWGPGSLLPSSCDGLDVEFCDTAQQALKGADIAMVLRLQRERMRAGLLPSEKEYQRYYRLTAEHLQWMKKDGLIFHPGPQNRGVEITSEVLDDQRQARVAQQVEIGVLVRMAVLRWVFANENV